MNDLETLIGRVCREQPALKAPAGLGARIVAEIERRAALPWWRRSFVHWPVTMRAVFVAVCAALIWASSNPAVMRLSGSLDAPLSWAFRTGVRLSMINGEFSRVASTLAHSMSPLWLYGAGLGVCSLYVLFAGLCAATYRTLYVSH